MSFFGEASNTFATLLKQARKRVVMITHNDNKARRGMPVFSKRRLSNAVAIAAYLDKHGVSYFRSDHIIDFGQPLKSLRDAERFSACYASKGVAKLIYPELIELNDGEYQYFLPKERNISVFVVDTDGKIVLR
jgi:hypothetical protein